MITYRKLGQFIRVAEFHFDEDGTAEGADIVRHLWRSAPVPGIRCEQSHTLEVDLTNSPEGLFANMHKETRSRVRRAEKDGFGYDFWSDSQPEVVGQFCRFYDEFAASKHLVPANRQRLRALGQIGALNLSCVRDAAGRVLVWHAHYCTADRARQIHSASLLRTTTDPSLRTLIGRANCYHTWSDMLRFRHQGIAVHDLGGWYGGNEDQQKLRINKFKESFGGLVIKEFNSEAAVTWTGRLAIGSKAVLLHLLACSRGLKPLPAPQGAAPESH